MATHAEKARKARRFYIRQIEEIVPRGFPGDDDHWQPTIEPHDRFADAMKAFEEEDTPLTRSLVRETGQQWVDSWHRAVYLWKKERTLGKQKVGA